MTISDIITIISLIIAIVAIISEKNRKHLLLKFSNFDFVLYVLAFLLINYFVFYDEFYANGYFISFLYFDNFGLSNPSNYAYIISILILISIILKINVPFFPFNKKDKVLNFYRNLIENNDITTLLDLIERYHLKDIKNHIESSTDDDSILDEITFRYIQLPTFSQKFKNSIITIWQKLCKYSKLNRYSFAHNVLFVIVNDPAFKKLASNQRPYFFSNIISTFKKEKANLFPSDLARDFFSELIKEKNFWLIKELKESDRYSYGLIELYFDENKIIASLLKDVSVANVNNISVSFGEAAIKEINSEKNLGINSKLYQQYQNDDILWNFQVYISIKFFNILIIEAIKQGHKGSNFKLCYYWFITEKILDNFISTPPKDFENSKSYYHYMIELMNENLFSWLNLSNKYLNDLFYDIVICIGNQIDCIVKNDFFGEQRKIDFIDNILSNYCDFDEKSKTDIVREELEKILLQPSISTNQSDSYYRYISRAWEKFDKLPHRTPGISNVDYDYFKRLKENVIKKIGLDPNIY